MRNGLDFFFEWTLSGMNDVGNAEEEYDDEKNHQGHVEGTCEFVAHAAAAMRKWKTSGCSGVSESRGEPNVPCKVKRTIFPCCAITIIIVITFPPFVLLFNPFSLSFFLIFFLFFQLNGETNQNEKYGSDLNMICILW